MKFNLGVETITAINDGGVGIQYCLDGRRINFPPGRPRPVLSVEVFQ